MNIIYGLPQSINERPTVLTIGAFDGVHRGHAHLISTTVQRARALECQAAVLTFDPHPDVVVRPGNERPTLTTIVERAELIAALGADLMIVMPFTRELMVLTAHEFMACLCGSLAIRELCIGWDFALGRGREGNAERLAAIGQTFGYTVYRVEPFLLDGEIVSSTRIRAALDNGDIESANRLLGYPYGLRGPIVEGDRRGRTIGFPTANIHVDPRRMLPAHGVYVCRALLGGVTYGAVTNVGVRPTFDGARRTVEAYLLDFSDEVYGEELRLMFLHRLRGEQKFDGITSLVAQITRDVAAARDWLQAHDVV
ncbi:MAG: bifunctional riboflavin kinase/FAD synthetase [Roseiflexus sp.]|jgi:riboflavin kinase/FMN adenylyltransferase|nr:bifunctional riboflavin kinase/FAD synthetase [Roseiflexus sp.]MBO9363632.1 bifunctional riboflavin kinase/FAD synthetase [Roseiflexus sp.]MBO9387730.1 bifunctional riboflavin kinase/FAD synthetase [Roseiflexus sp.]